MGYWGYWEGLDGILGVVEEADGILEGPGRGWVGYWGYWEELDEILEGDEWDTEGGIGRDE